MKPYYQDNSIRIINGDCGAMDLPDESVQCVVTSPPYWGLRKYSGMQDLIWGEKNCEHEWGNAEIKELNYVQGNPEFARPHREHKSFRSETNTCSLCGAWKGQYGLEPTPEKYVQHTIEILREIRRVLRKDGVVFWNIGDSYCGGNRGQWDGDRERFHGINKEYTALASAPNRLPQMGLKPKDLCLIPFRVAIAAQEDGWWVRSIIIWSKPNPMPESVTDRPTESHEYILMLTKSAKYYWDADAVRERADTPLDCKSSQTFGAKGGKAEAVYGHKVSGEQWVNNGGRNIRSVWEFPTQPYPEAHFAVFPEKLPEICIKAASKPDDLVLDPFMGSGTTLWVAKKLGRRAVGYELSEEYCQLAVERNRQQAMELKL